MATLAVLGLLTGCDGEEEGTGDANVSGELADDGHGHSHDDDTTDHDDPQGGHDGDSGSADRSGEGGGHDDHSQGDGDSHDDAPLDGGEYVGMWEIMGGDTILNLNINPDGTFEINGVEGGNDFTVDGTWAKERFMVILKTEQIRGMPLEAEWTANLHEGKLRIARGDLGPELVFDAD